MLQGSALLLHTFTAAALTESFTGGILGWELAEPGSQPQQITHARI